jgi:hypothetical protein
MSMPAAVEEHVQLGSSVWQGDGVLIWKLHSTDATPFTSNKKLAIGNW